MKKKKDGIYTILSFILSLVMMLSTCNSIVFASDILIENDERLLISETKITDTIQATKVDKNTKIDVNSFSTNSLIHPNSLLPSDEEKYLVELGQQLNTKLGIVGFKSNMQNNENTDIIVTLNIMPSEILPKYEELQGNSISRKKAVDIVEESHTNFESEFSKLGMDFDEVMIQEYSTLFNGYALTVPTSALSAIASLSSVYSVTPDYAIYALDSEITDNDFNEPSMGMNESRELFNMDYINNELGITGKGVTVGVLDTGIDYNHPDLKEAYKGGYNYVTTEPLHAEDDAQETTYDDWLQCGAEKGEPLVNSNGKTYFTYHGSHVSGIIAGRGTNNSPYATLGLAPQVSLRAYRILGAYGIGQTSWLVSATEQSLEDHCQIINLSVTIDVNSAYNPIIQVLNNAVLANMVVSLAAGNSGSELWSICVPGTAALPITVAAGVKDARKLFFYNEATFINDNQEIELSVPLYITGYNTNNSFTNNEIGGSNLYNAKNKGYEIVFIDGWGESKDFKGLDLTGKIAVINRGVTEHSDKLKNAIDHNAAAMLYINNQDEFVNDISISGVKQDFIPIISVRQKDGMELKKCYDKSMDNGEKIYLNLGILTTEDSKYELTNFSSRGPVNSTLHIKPDIVAPGFEVMSTVPAYVTNADYNNIDYTYAYERKDGTSMATPHVTAVAALILEKYPNSSPSEIKARIMNTAIPMDGFSVFEIGAGWINPLAAVLTNTIINVKDNIPTGNADKGEVEVDGLASLSFGGVYKTIPQENYPTKKIQVSVKNNSDESKIYSLSYNLSDNAINNKVNFFLSQTDLSVPAGDSVTFESWLLIPNEAEPAYFDGYLVISETTLQNDMDNISDLVWRLPFGVYFSDIIPSQNSITNAFIARPYITSNSENAQSVYSLSTSLNIEIAESLKKIYSVIFDDTTLKPIGVCSYVDITDTSPGRYWIYDFYQSEYQPFDEAGELLPEKILPDGVYRIGAAVYDMQNSVSWYNFGKIIVDSEKPIFSMDTDIQQVFEYPKTTDSFSIEGNIYSNAIQQGMTHDVSYNYYKDKPILDQSWNGLVVDSVLHYTDENGNFSIPIKIAESSRNTVTICKIYAVDAFADTYYARKQIVIGNNRTEDIEFAYIEAAAPIEVVATNGTVSLILDKEPYYAPILEDFIGSIEIQGTSSSTLRLNDFAYDTTSHTAKFTFKPLTEEECQYFNIGIKYKGSYVNSEVVKIEKDAIYPSSIIVNCSDLVVIKKGESQKIIASTLPYGAKLSNVSWSSSNENVASVDNNGLVIGKSMGMVMITVTVSGVNGSLISKNVVLRVTA